MTMQRRRLWVVVYAALAAVGCGGAPAGPSDVTGTFVDTFITERGEVRLPGGPGEIELAALAQMP
jgi:hypothetical protein